MKNVIRSEEVAVFCACVFALILLHVPWWVYPLLIIGPDISMLGYLGGNKLGAICYNIFHHKGIAIIVFVIGVIISDYSGEIVNVIGIILFGHSSMDRALGYGLKYFQGFKFTHLGEIGKR